MSWLLATLLATGTAQAGAWTRTQGSFYVKAGEDMYAASEYVAPDYETPEGQSFLGAQTVLYGEVGLIKQHPVMLVAQVPLAWNTLYLAAPGGDNPRGRPRASTIRMADVTVSVQTALLPKGKPLATAVSVKVPGYANDGVGKDFGDYQDYFPRIGDGQIDVTAWVLGGASKGKVWSDAAIGYRFRTEAFMGWENPNLNFLDTLVISDTTGYTAGKLIAMVRFELMKALGTDLYTREGMNIGPLVLYDLNDKGLAIEGRLAFDVWANNATRGMGGGIGLSMRK